VGAARQGTARVESDAKGRSSLISSQFIRIRLFLRAQELELTFGKPVVAIEPVFLLEPRQVGGVQDRPRVTG